MSLIEGIGDEVTVLVTVIVAVATVVAAWFSTSVQEQHSYWQDRPGSVVDPASVVDPESSTSESTYSEEDGRDTVSDTPSSRETHNAVGTGDEHKRGNETEVPASEVPLSQSHSNRESQGMPSGNSKACYSTTADNNSTGRQENEQNIASSGSQYSGFDPSEATTESDNQDCCTSDPFSGVDASDGVSMHHDPPEVIVQERVEDVHVSASEQCVRKRTIPASTASPAIVSAEGPEGGQEPLTNESEHSSESQSTGSRSETFSQAETGATGSSQRIRDQSASGVISIKLKFLDETDRMVSTNMDDTLGNFRRETFAAEIRAGKTVRLISNGQLLTDDSRTLATYGITNQHVIHCQVSQAGTGQGHHRRLPSDAGGGEHDLGRYMVPLFACILAFVWYLRFQYRFMFNATSTLSLTAVTVVFLLALLAAWRA
ncbi:uncharacterized protein [Diadema antillarum]|uniref:uncharacterized protein n=1 Tax=Diadema antillarum TaxID=105358 RepID=UPI003A891794